MVYVEYLRIRKSLTWYVGIIAVLAIGIMLLGGGQATVHVDSASGQSTFQSGMSAPLAALAAVSAFLAAIFASSAGISFNRESQTRDISWTKPISRTLLALQFVAVDIAGIVIAYAVALLAMVLALWKFHVSTVVDDQFVLQLVLGIGIATMWYGLLEAITSPFGPAARAMSGVLWPVALVLAGLSHVGGPTGAVVRAIDVINPLMYISSTGTNGRGSSMNVALTDGGSAGSIAYAPAELRALLVWVFTAAFLALAVTLWPKKEA